MSLLFQCFVDSILLGGLYSLMAIGLSLGFGVTRIINFAHGEMIMLGAYGAYFGAVALGVDPLLSLPVAPEAASQVCQSTYYYGRRNLF